MLSTTLLEMSHGSGFESYDGIRERPPSLVPARMNSTE
jgi:hypothetical protein